MDAGRPPMAAALEGARGAGGALRRGVRSGHRRVLGLAFGLWGEAYSEATAALAIARDLQHREWTVYALSSLGRVHALCGDTGHRREHCTASSSRSPASSARSIWIAEALGRLGQGAFPGR